MVLPASARAVPLPLLTLPGLGAPAWACLLCFTTYAERQRVCQFFVGEEGSMLDKCEEAFVSAFKGLLDTEISEETPPTPSSRRSADGGTQARGRPGTGTGSVWRWG